MTDWPRLQQAFSALILALHEKHAHITNHTRLREAGICPQCGGVNRAERKARTHYEDALEETIG
jgi:hypothetical protein